VYGTAARYVSRPDPAEVGTAIADLVDDGPARREVLASARAVLARYRWSDTAAATLAAIEEAGAR
jgi:glycosyltransferase involved in cell wall biosynthesis